jgi:hypothetical protein
MARLCERVKRELTLGLPTGGSFGIGCAGRGGEARTALLAQIATARSWLDDLVSGRADLKALANREGKTERSARMTVSLAFLAPDIVEAAVEGQLPKGTRRFAVDKTSPFGEAIRASRSDFLVCLRLPSSELGRKPLTGLSTPSKNCMPKRGSCVRKTGVPILIIDTAV